MRRNNPPILPEKPTLEYEMELWGEGFRIIAGLDEAGRGAWAGPVYAAAVVLPNDERICGLLHGVRDSKKMTAAARERWQECIKSTSVAWAVGSASEREIDRVGIVGATRAAMRRALKGLLYQPDYLLIDYISIEKCGCPQLSLPYGDCLSLSVAAASILAKTSRDAFMVSLNKKYPGYNFAQHKGYGTPEHRELLHRNGVSAAHRRSYRPVKERFEI